MKHELKIEELHRPDYFRRHCEIVLYLLQLPDLEHPAVKHHVRGAIREASHHASRGPGYDNKRGAHYMSVGAMKQMEQGDFDGLVGDHLVPVSVLNHMIVSEVSSTWEGIAQILLTHGARAVITKAEHKLLQELRLHKDMPPNWDRRNPYARYKAAGIKLEPNQYQELKQRSG